MKRLFLTMLIAAATLAANAQYDGNTILGKSRHRTSGTSSSSSWDGSVYGVGYTANFDYAEKGAFTLEAHGFEKTIGLSMKIGNFYDLASEKIFNSFVYAIGPNVNLKLGPNLILFSPVCLTVGSAGGSSKLNWGALASPSLGLKLGHIFLSGGWNVSYSFKGKEFETECFTAQIGYYL